MSWESRNNKNARPKGVLESIASPAHPSGAYASGYQKKSTVFSLFQPEGLGFKSLWHRHRCIMELKGQAVGLRYSKFLIFNSLLQKFTITQAYSLQHRVYSIPRAMPWAFKTQPFRLKTVLFFDSLMRIPFGRGIFHSIEGT